MRNDPNNRSIYIYIYIYIVKDIPKLESNLNALQGDWLVGCFGFNGPLRQYFSLYRAISQREGEREERRIDESKNVQTTPTRTYYKRSRPWPYCNSNCRTPRHWKFTQHHRTTRPPPCKGKFPREKGLLLGLILQKMGLGIFWDQCCKKRQTAIHITGVLRRQQINSTHQYFTVAY